ncbi:hypothetical protein PLESTB_000043100 [Pleodorina starrii]|uniref:BTB domain-containing protein n=1 Tax=Pleodorina starrii TaxID=330485 RepID=A0A9W6B987_9CHLO|nr:hypothetical protein PLESTB_000043100 [Pleodorina starrii]
MVESASKSVLRGLPEVFASNQFSDCDVIFCLDEIAPTRTAQPSTGAASCAQGGPEGADLSLATADGPNSSVVFGDPLPAHRLILGLASERFTAQIVRWSAEGADEITSPSQPGQSACSRPQLRIPLGSAAEVPAARAAIRFAYTGEVPADSSVRQVLELRRQGAYLQISGCVAACDEVLAAKVSSSSTATVASSHVEGGSNKRARTSEQAPQQPPAYLQLFESEVLWPDPQAEPAFGAILATGKRLLVPHFGNSLAALNTPSLRDQLLALPAVALEALLESDEFGTDDEASVLLMLAEWMRTNFDQAEPAIRQRLCRAVRLVHLSRPYLSLIIPALATDHEKDPEAPAGWFSGADALEAAFVATYVSTTQVERDCLLSAGKASGPILESLRARPRPQCIPPSGGLTFNWHIPKEDLLQAVRQLQPGSSKTVSCTFDDPSLHAVAARGFCWSVSVKVTSGQSTAGLFLHSDLSTALTPPGSRLSSEGTVTKLTIVHISARLVVHRRQGGAVRNVEGTFSSPEYFLRLGTGRGWSTLLPLKDKQQQQDATGNTAAVAAAAAADPLAAWVEYLTDGKVSGTLTLLRPSV